MTSQHGPWQQRNPCGIHCWLKRGFMIWYIADHRLHPLRSMDVDWK